MVVLLLCALVSLCLAGPYDGPEWQAKDRNTKLNEIWDDLVANPTPLPWYSAARVAEMFIEDMKPSFDSPQDSMPFQYIGNFYERRKLIHTVSVVARAEFKITGPNNYTGLFASGCDSAIIRLSLAGAPTSDGDGFRTAPGLAFKCFRDGTPSANIVSMYSLLGQPSFNFFLHDFTNHVPAPNPIWMSMSERALFAKFRTVSDWPSMLGLSDFANADKIGAPTDKPEFPYRIVFHPNKLYHTGFPSNFTGVPFYEQLMKGLNLGLLYDVYAQSAPLLDNSRLQKIGEIHLTTLPTTSDFSDRHLFVQHTRMEDDLKLKPEWLSPATMDLNRQQAAPARPGFQYGDLPW